MVDVLEVIIYFIYLQQYDALNADPGIASAGGDFSLATVLIAGGSLVAGVAATITALLSYKFSNISWNYSIQCQILSLKSERNDYFLIAVRKGNECIQLRSDIEIKKLYRSAFAQELASISKKTTECKERYNAAIQKISDFEDSNSNINEDRFVDLEIHIKNEL